MFSLKYSRGLWCPGHLRSQIGNCGSKSKKFRFGCMCSVIVTIKMCLRANEDWEETQSKSGSVWLIDDF